MSAENVKPGERATPRISVIRLPGGPKARGAPQAGSPPERDGFLVEVVAAQAVFVDNAPGGEARALRAGSAVAMNLAATGAAGEILAFLGPELEPAPGWAQAVAAFFDEHPHAEVAVGRTLLRPQGVLAVAEAALEGSPAAGEDGGIRVASSLHCAVRRESFERTGGLNEGPPSLVVAHSALGGLLAGREGQAAEPHGMVAYRAPCDTLAALLGRQFRMGLAAYYSPVRRPFGAGLRIWLAAPGRAVGLAARARQVPALIPCLVSGAAARATGAFAGFVRGGRRLGPLPSPLVGPESAFLVPEDDAQARPVATVVVPVHRQPEWLSICLASLYRQDIAEPYEVLTVLDDPDGFAAHVREAFPKVRVRFFECGRGAGGGRNVGTAAARGDYLAFTDDDCLPERDWLRLIVEACRSNVGRPVTGSTKVGEAGCYVTRAHSVSDHGAGQGEGRRPAGGISGGNMCISRRLLQESGAAFAEGVYGAEDVALYHQLPAESRRALREPAARVRHLRTDSLTEFLGRAYRLGIGSGRVRKSFRMPGSVFARHVWLVPFLPPVRLALTAARTARCGLPAVLEFIRLSPLIACRYVWYAAGFAAGALSAPANKIPTP